MLDIKECIGIKIKGFMKVKKKSGCQKSLTGNQRLQSSTKILLVILNIEKSVNNWHIPHPPSHPSQTLFQ